MHGIHAIFGPFVGSILKSWLRLIFNPSSSSDDIGIPRKQEGKEGVQIIRRIYFGRISLSSSNWPGIVF